MTTGGQSADRLEVLLAGALAVWGLSGTVAPVPTAAGAVLARADGTAVSVLREANGWRVVTEAGASRHAGVPGMLRALRRALAPEQRPGRMIVAPSPGTD